jgi:hypothetical protein
MVARRRGDSDSELEPGELGELDEESGQLDTKEACVPINRLGREARNSAAAPGRISGRSSQLEANDRKYMHRQQGGHRSVEVDIPNKARFT